MESPDSSASPLSSLRRKGNRILQELEFCMELREMHEWDGQGLPAFVKENIQTLLKRISLFVERVESLNVSSEEEVPTQRIHQQINRIAVTVQNSIKPLELMLTFPDADDEGGDFDNDDDDDGPDPTPIQPSSLFKKSSAAPVLAS